MNTQKAKKILRNYWIVTWTVTILVLIAYIPILMSGNSTLILISLLFAILILFTARNMTTAKFITGPLYKDLDAPLHREIVYTGKCFTPSAVWQIQAEYACGNYADVIAICQKKLTEPKMVKKYRYNYCAFMANVWFDIGNDEKLAEVCGLYEQYLAAESARKRARIQRRSRRMEFYRSYLKRDFAGCQAYLNQPQSLGVIKIQVEFAKGRLALLQGDTEYARAVFTAVLQKAPSVTFGELARHGLAAIDTDTAYRDTFDEIIPNENVIIRNRTKAASVCIVIRNVVLIVSCVLFLLSSSLLLFLKVYDAVQEKKYEAEYDEHTEMLRLLLEEDYDGVTVLDAFNLTKDGFIADSMFLFRTEKSVFIGCLFSYPDDPAMYYDIKHELPLSKCETPPELLMHVWFPCTVTPYYVYSFYCTDSAEIPDSYEHVSSLETDGVTLYYVVTEIGDEPDLGQDPDSVIAQ